ncbi:hypothetical protein D3C76_89420 [compost metagenome]
MADVDKLVHNYELTHDQAQVMWSMCALAVHVDIMIEESFNDSGCDSSEDFMNRAHVSFSEPVAAALIEKVINFHNCGIRPYGFETLRTIMVQEEGFVITDVVPLREDDSMVYVFTNMSDGD